MTQIVRSEVEKRFGDAATVSYYDIKNPEVKAAHPELIADMEKRGLLYPVTVMDGVPVYDGAVSYPAILRAVQNKLAKTETATAN
ncbi:MAG: DUF1462 family protein [Actinomycetota bacterium]|nr:DUF1462 family protein [Actinomycetota bacterium]